MQDQEDAFDLERLTWEAGEEHHDEEDADTPLRTATAPATPVRPALPEHFNVHLPGADIELGGSLAPAGMAAAPGWSAPGWAANAGLWPSGGIQDPWTQSADPWASWDSGWHRPNWRGWWGDAAPPSHPPGVPIAAAPEQGTGCAETYDGWRYGGWNWLANSQNYNNYNRWAASANYSSWSFGRGSLAEGWRPKHVPDKKDVEKPEKYLGDITKWLLWSSAFTRFFKKLDDRWPKILSKLEQLKGMLVTSQIEEAWAWELWTSDLMHWKEQLFQLLESFTTGDVAKLVVAGEERGVCGRG